MLQGLRRELTRELFEDLGALQCEIPEILGYSGTTEKELQRWCRRTYRRPLPAMLEMVRQDGLIAIRRASFEQLKRSATLITQQFNRFLPAAPPGEAEKTAAARAFAALLDPPEEEIREVFE